MKSVVLAIGVIIMSMGLAACGGQKTDLAVGQELAKSGNCGDAVSYFDSTIAEPDMIMDMAYAYYGKARCAEKAGDIPAAYENYYAAKVVACYAVAHDKNTNLNTYARSEFCQKIIPEKLAELAPEAGDTKAIRSKVNATLNERYLERFVSE